MKTQKLGKDLQVSAIGLGCMGMSHAYGKPADKDEMVRLIQDAYQQGCNFFDTAEVYVGQNPDGSLSYNEEIVGEALKEVRDKVIIASKCGIKIGENRELITDARPETIRKSLESSLERLSTDYIDLYYLHRIDPKVPIEVVAQTMKELIEEGKIRYWGISEADEETIRKAHSICPLTAVQNRYSMMYREYESLFDTLEELQISLVAFSPLANGFLSGAYDQNSTFDQKFDYRSTMPQFQKDAYDKNKELLSMLHRLAKEKKCTPAQLSLAWMINKKSYIIPIPGTRKSNRLKENLGASKIVLSKDEIDKIDKILDTMDMSNVYGRAN